MTKYTQDEQTEIVRFARDLTATIELEEKELETVKAEVFEEEPEPPQKRVVEIPEPVKVIYPPAPRTNYGFMDFIKEKAIKNKKIFAIAGIVLGVICCIAIPILLIVAVILSVNDLWGVAFYFLYVSLFTIVSIISIPVIIGVIVGIIALINSYSKRRKEIVIDLSNTPEHVKKVKEAERIAAEKQACLDEEFRKEQEKADKEYADNTYHYENVTLSEYYKALDAWRQKQETKIGILEEEIALNKESLNDLYDTTKLVSLTYRPLWILSWLYEDMSSSDHDLRYATELLDRDRQRLATEEAASIVKNSLGHMEQTMKIGLGYVYNAIEEGNYLQEESINELTKVRRTVRNGNFIGTIQRHNTNKRLDKLIDIAKSK